MDRSTRVDVTRTTNNGAVIKMYFKDDNGRCNELPDITISTSKNVKKLDVAIKPLQTEQKLDTRQSQELNIPADDTSDDEMPHKEELENESSHNHYQENATSIKNDNSSVSNDDSSIKNDNASIGNDDDDDNDQKDQQSAHSFLSTSSQSSSSNHSSSENQSSSSQSSSSEEQPNIIYDPETHMPIHVPTPIKAWEDPSYSPPNIPPPNKSLEDKNYSPQNVSTPKQQLHDGDHANSYYPPTPRISIQNATSPKLPSLKTLFDGSWKTDNQDETADDQGTQQPNLDINQQELSRDAEVSNDPSDDSYEYNENDDQLTSEKEFSELSIHDIDHQNYDYDQNGSSSLSEWSKFMES